MKKEIIMPQMGESIAEGTLSKWLKKTGDFVKAEEALFEVSTDKIDTEIPSPASGYLVEIIVKEGETVPINTIVAYLETEEFKMEEKEIESKKIEEKVEAEIIPELNQKKEILKQHLSPAVRRLIREHNLDISKIKGSGIDGRITAKDVMKYMQTQTVPPPPLLKEEKETKLIVEDFDIKGKMFPTEGQRIEVIPMTNMRRKIAEHMIYSKRTSAHVTTFFEVDMNRIVKMRDELKQSFSEQGIKLTYISFVIYGAAKALRVYPIVNASVSGTDIIYKKDINIGIAVALEWGLVVPVIKNADTLNLMGIAKKVQDLSERARNKRLMPEEVLDGTFSITNPGVFGALMGTPIINQPQVAILGMGAIVKRPVVIDDAIAIRPMMYLSLSYDHRIIDGAVADAFLANIKNTLETFPQI